MNNTVALLPTVLSEFAALVAGLPAQLASVPTDPTIAPFNYSVLATMLNDFSTSVAPILPSIAAVQTEDLLTNVTWLTEQVGVLEQVTANIWPTEIEALSRESLLQLIEFGATRFQVTTVWSPDPLAMLFSFIIAFTYFFLSLLLQRKSVLQRAYDAEVFRCTSLRATSTGKMEAPDQLSAEDLEAMTPSRFRSDELVRRKSRQIIAHFWNLAIATIAFTLQCVAWRLFIFPKRDFRFLDAKMAFLACKLVLFSYAAELSFASPHSYIYLHHFLSFAVPLVALIAAYQTNCVSVIRLGQWWLIQATLEQPTYLAMILYHSSNYLDLQGINPVLSRKLLIWASWCLDITKWWSYPQKIFPIAMALYWLIDVWGQEKASGRLGVFWLCWALIILFMLIALQLFWVCDQNFAIAAHLKSKINDTPPPPRSGPLMRFLVSLVKGRRTRGRSHRRHKRLQSNANTRFNTTTDMSAHMEKGQIDTVTPLRDLTILNRLDAPKVPDISTDNTPFSTPRPSQEELGLGRLGGFGGFFMPLSARVPFGHVRRATSGSRPMSPTPIETIGPFPPAIVESDSESEITEIMDSPITARSKRTTVPPYEDVESWEVLAGGVETAEENEEDDKMTVEEEREEAEFVDAEQGSIEAEVEEEEESEGGVGEEVENLEG